MDILNQVERLGEKFQMPWNYFVIENLNKYQVITNTSDKFNIKMCNIWSM